MATLYVAFDGFDMDAPVMPVYTNEMYEPGSPITHYKQVLGTFAGPQTSQLPYAVSGLGDFEQLGNGMLVGGELFGSLHIDHAALDYSTSTITEYDMYSPLVGLGT